MFSYDSLTYSITQLWNITCLFVHTGYCFGKLSASPLLFQVLDYLCTVNEVKSLLIIKKANIVLPIDFKYSITM